MNIYLRTIFQRLEYGNIEDLPVYLVIQIKESKEKRSMRHKIKNDKDDTYADIEEFV